MTQQEARELLVELDRIAMRMIAIAAELYQHNEYERKEK